MDELSSGLQGVVRSTNVRNIDLTTITWWILKAQLLSCALFFALSSCKKLLIVSFQHFNVCEVEKFMLDNVDKKSYNIFTVRQGSESSRAKKIQRNLKKELDKPEGKWYNS